MGRAEIQELDDSSSEDNQLGFWLTGLVVGAVGGAAIAFLTAPKSGTELRGSLERGAKNMPEKLNEAVDDSLDLYASFLNYCQLTIEEQTLRFKRAIAAGKLAAAKKREEIEYGGTSQLPFQSR